MSESSGYRELVVWQKSMDLVELIYQITASFPDSERFGLSNQLQRAAISIPSNIAEGYGRGGGDYRRHVNIARGSLMEIETQIEIAVRLNYISKDEIKQAWSLSQEIGRMLTKLSQALKDRK